MSIEQTLERIATALERLVETKCGNPTSPVTEEVVKKKVKKTEAVLVETADVPVEKVKVIET